MKYNIIKYEKNQLKTKINTIKEKINFLESHNKNYTKKQYYKIIEIQEILEQILNQL